MARWGLPGGASAWLRRPEAGGREEWEDVFSQVDMGDAERKCFLLPTPQTLRGPVAEAGIVAPSPRPGLLWWRASDKPGHIQASG